MMTVDQRIVELLRMGFQFKLIDGNRYFVSGV